MRTPCPNKRAAALKVDKATWQGRRLIVSGRIDRAAKRKVKVTARCGSAKVSKRTMPRRVRWKGTLRLPRRCSKAGRAKVSASYPGGQRLRRASATRRVRRGPQGGPIARRAALAAVRSLSALGW